MQSGIKELVSVSECCNLCSFLTCRNTIQRGFTFTPALARFMVSSNAGSYKNIRGLTCMTRSRERCASTLLIEHLKIRPIARRRSLFVSMGSQAPAKTAISPSLQTLSSKKAIIWLFLTNTLQRVKMK